MPKIALIELYHHAEVLRSFYHALQEHELSIFASPGFEMNGLYSEIGKNCPFYLRPENQSVPDFLSTNQQLFNQFDWLLFITIENHYVFFAKQQWKPKTILLIHDGNYWLDYQRNISLTSISKIGKWIRDLIGRQAQNRRGIVERMDYLMFPDPVIRDYIIERGLLKAGKCLPSLPLHFGKQNGMATRKNEITIVIPGSIKIGMRDYWQVVNAFEDIGQKFKKPVTLVLLGKPVGRSGLKVQEKSRRLEGGNFSVVCFSEQIHQQEYDKWLAMADFFILPFRKNIRVSECSEIGGLTKISGSMNDALRFQKFALVSDGYVLHESYNKVTMKYSDAFDLGNKIVALLDSLPISVDFFDVLSRWEREHKKVTSILNELAMK